MMTLKEKQKEIYGYNFCEVCGITCYPDEHHIIFKSEKPRHPEMENPMNKILVCRDCHNKFHAKKSNRNEIVEMRKLNTLFGNDVLNK